MGHFQALWLGFSLGALMTYMRRPWTFLSVLFIVFLACFSVIKWNRYRSRQARLCTTSTLCRIQELGPLAKAPPVSLETLHPLFSQPLFFLGKGKQSVAYETADGKYVLKLFKQATKKNKKKQLEQCLMGAVIARSILPEETGVIACVCNQHSMKLSPITIMTRKGKIVKINLQDTPFILQRRAQPFKKTLLRLVSEKRLKDAASRLESLFSLLTICRERGVVDTDGSLIRNENIGFVDGKAILFDTGKLQRLYDKTRLTLHDLNRLKPLQSWLESACPELIPTYNACLDRFRLKDADLAKK